MNENTVLRFKFKTISEWKVPNKMKKTLQDLCVQEINMKKVRNILKHTHTYCINESGLTIKPNGEKVGRKSKAQYKMAQLDGYTNDKNEHIYIWKCLKSSGVYGNVIFGTRYDFDTIIVNAKNNNNE